MTSSPIKSDYDAIDQAIVSSSDDDEQLYENPIERFYETLYANGFLTQHTLYYLQDEHRRDNFFDARNDHIVGWSPSHAYEVLEASRDARRAYMAKHTSNKLVWEAVGSYWERDGESLLLRHEIKALNDGANGKLAVAWYRYLSNKEGLTSRTRQCISYATQRVMAYGNAQDPNDGHDSYTEEESDADVDMSPTERIIQEDFAFYKQPVEQRMTTEQRGVEEGPEQKPYERAVVGKLVYGDSPDDAAPTSFQLLYSVVSDVLNKEATLEAQLVIELKNAEPTRENIQKELTMHCNGFLFHQDLEMTLNRIHYYEARSTFDTEKLAFAHVAVQIKRAPPRDRFLYSGHCVVECSLDVWLSTRLLDFNVPSQEAA